MRSSTLTDRKPEPTGVVVGPLMPTFVRRSDARVSSGKGLPVASNASMPASLDVPFELHAGRLEHAPRGLRQFGAGSVTRNERHFVRHGGSFGHLRAVGRAFSVSDGIRDRPATYAPAGGECDDRWMRRGGTIQLARIFGIRIGVGTSWFVVLFFFIYVLSGYFGQVLGSNTRATSSPSSARCCSSSR